MSGGKNITIPRLHFMFYILDVIVHCIQHFKLNKNWNWAINVNLMLKITVGKNNV